MDSRLVVVFVDDPDDSVYNRLSCDGTTSIIIVDVAATVFVDRRQPVCLYVRNRNPNPV